MNRSSPPRFIFGAGEQADHVLRLMEWMDLPTAELAFFDDGFPQRSSGPGGLRVLGTIEEGVAICAQRGDPAMIAIGTKGAAFRYGLYRRLQQVGVPLSSLLHPSAAVSPTASVGENAVVMPGVALAKGVTVGALCCLFSNVTLEHDTTVGDNVFIGPAVATAGHVRIGKHAFVGVGAVLSAGVVVGERTLIGAGAVVVGDIPAGVIAMGVPARVHRIASAGLDVPTEDELKKWRCEP